MISGQVCKDVLAKIPKVQVKMRTDKLNLKLKPLVLQRATSKSEKTTH